MKKLFAAWLIIAAFALGRAYAQAPDISYTQLVNMMASGKVALIDCNGSWRYQQGHIPGAIDLSANYDNLAALLPADRDATVVCYCADPHCHAWQQGVKAARALGYRNVLHFSGGIQGWIMAGGQVTR